jgi:hypothetical protein
VGGGVSGTGERVIFVDASDYARQLALLKWSKVTPEERRAYAQKLAHAFWDRLTVEQRRAECAKRFRKKRKLK